MKGVSYKALKAAKQPLIIAGPCSAESKAQLDEVTAHIINDGRVNLIRSGIWKPRTRPGSFEGLGQEALEWIKDLQTTKGVLFTIEVANANHVEAALKADINHLWIGARSSVSPFTVQEIADAVHGQKNIHVLVKNPVSPDLKLWLGAVERIEKAGVDDIGVVHRGFTAYPSSQYRNSPVWSIPIELKRLRPDLPLITDPSHITGKRDWVKQIAQQAFDLDMDGLMVETHPNPPLALSDADQQLYINELSDLLDSLEYRSVHSENAVFNQHLENLRNEIDLIDIDLLDTLAKRIESVKKIAEYKKEHKITVLQLERWKEIIESRSEYAQGLAIDLHLTKRILEAIHESSIELQNIIVNETQDSSTVSG